MSFAEQMQKQFQTLMQGTTDPAGQLQEELPEATEVPAATPPENPTLDTPIEEPFSPEGRTNAARMALQKLEKLRSGE
jgi:hypothetical protein